MITFQGKDVVIINGVKYRKSKSISCVNCAFNSMGGLSGYCFDVWNNNHGRINGYKTYKIAHGYKKFVPDRVILKYL